MSSKKDKAQGDARGQNSSPAKPAPEDESNDDDSATFSMRGMLDSLGKMLPDKGLPRTIC